MHIAVLENVAECIIFLPEKDEVRFGFWLRVVICVVTCTLIY